MQRTVRSGGWRVRAGFARALMRELACQLAHQREPAYAAALGELDYRRTYAPAH
jgi:hypothetical protein